MKKLMALMIGMGLVLSTTAISFAQETKEPTKTEKKKKKKGGKKKGEKKQEETKPGA